MAPCSDVMSLSRKRRDRNRKVKCKLWSMVQKTRADCEVDVRLSKVDDLYSLRPDSYVFQAITEQMSRILGEFVQTAVEARLVQEWTCAGERQEGQGEEEGQEEGQDVRVHEEREDVMEFGCSRSDVRNEEGFGQGQGELCCDCQSGSEEEETGSRHRLRLLQDHVEEQGEEEEGQCEVGDGEREDEEESEDYAETSVESEVGNMGSYRWRCLDARDEAAYACCSRWALKLRDGE